MFNRIEHCDHNEQTNMSEVLKLVVLLYLFQIREINFANTLKESFRLFQSYAVGSSAQNLLDSCNHSIGKPFIEVLNTKTAVASPFILYWLAIFHAKFFKEI